MMDGGIVSGTKMKLKKKKKLKAFHQKKKLFRVYEPRLAVLVWGIGHSVSVLLATFIDLTLGPKPTKFQFVLRKSLSCICYDSSFLT